MNFAPDRTHASDAPSDGDSAATAVLFEACRALMRFAEPAMPTRLSIDPARRADDLSRLRTYSQMYALRAEGAARSDCHKADTNAPHLLATTAVAAADLARVVLAFARTSNGDPRPAEPAVQELLGVLLTWRLLTGSTADELRALTVASASHTAGLLTDGDPDKLGAAIGNMRTAVADLDPDPADEDYTMVAAELARDAYELGLSMLGRGDHSWARKWLTFAHAHGVQEAAALVPSAATDDVGSDTVDFATDPTRWREAADRANKTARFHPADSTVSTTDPDPEDAVPLPCVEIAGVQVYSYLHGKTGRLRVSLDLDTTQPWLLVDQERVPIEVTVGGVQVYTAD